MTFKLLAWTGQTSDAVVTLLFYGTNITKTGQTSPQGGFAKMTRCDKEGHKRSEVYTDFYSILTEETVCARLPTEQPDH